MATKASAATKPARKATQKKTAKAEPARKAAQKKTAEPEPEPAEDTTAEATVAAPVVDASQAEPFPNAKAYHAAIEQVRAAAAAYFAGDELLMDDADYDKQTGALEAGEQQREDRDKAPRISTRKWPLVRFHLPNGQTRDYLARPESWKTELPNGEVQASRTQVPLILAWAMSIHKSQGQTLPCCKIDLNRVFEKGQAYVALSRATSLEGLQVLGFRPDKVMAHPRVIQWSQSLIALSD